AEPPSYQPPSSSGATVVAIAVSIGACTACTAPATVPRPGWASGLPFRSRRHCTAMFDAVQMSYLLRTHSVSAVAASLPLPPPSSSFHANAIGAMTALACVHTVRRKWTSTQIIIAIHHDPRDSLEVRPSRIS
ncbi:hypothetical protein Vafri_8237, partial [Volvox africanus]